jgi:hypothetical protein
MELDASCLRWAKVENLERLARALHAPLPLNKRHNREAYHRALVRVIVRALENQSHSRYSSAAQLFSPL